MPIQMTTTSRQIKADYDRMYNSRVMKAIINTMRYVGEMCVQEARDNGSYTDQTGNLRSSIGYVVVKDGIIVENGNSQKYLEGTLGESEGVKFARQLAADAPRKGIVLIVSAGMNYAAYVEARGYNVLTSAELLADSLVPQILTSIGFKVKK